jgi:uncharacterized protein YecT (DUF1311 family)
MFRMYVLVVLFSLALVPCFAQHVNQKDSPCVHTGGTSEVSNCLTEAGNVANEKLYALYREIHSVLDAGEAEKLTAAQRSWLSYRSATCEAERSLYGAGSGSGPAYLACVEAVTRARIAELHVIYDWVLLKRKDDLLKNRKDSLF